MPSLQYVPTAPQKVVAYLRKAGFKAAVKDPRSKRLSEGFQAIKHPLKRGWVLVQYNFVEVGEYDSKGVPVFEKMFSDLETHGFHCVWTDPVGKAKSGSFAVVEEKESITEKVARKFL